jgi:thioredoxin-related protein
MNCRSILAVAGALMLGSLAGRAELNWLTDYDAALKQARTEGKLVLIDFTGSDWCIWCIKLKREVFDTREFGAFANANLVLLEVDFPRRKAQTEQQRAKNSVLQSRYGVEGYPTVIVANPDGHPLAQLGYEAGGPKAFIDGLKKIPSFSWKDGVAPNAPALAAKPDEPLWGGITFPPKRYDELKLTGLSGTATRRFAIINNQTFAAGETARVKLQGGDVKVLCKEIRAKSVLVQVEGAIEAKELVLGAN